MAQGFLTVHLLRRKEFSPSLEKGWHGIPVLARTAMKGSLFTGKAVDSILSCHICMKKERWSKSYMDF